MIEPPKVPAQYSAAIMQIAGTGSRVMVNGNSSATAIGELRPGKAPTMTPITTPPKIRAMLDGSRTSKRPWMTGSIPPLSYLRSEDAGLEMDAEQMGKHQRHRQRQDDGVGNEHLDPAFTP